MGSRFRWKAFATACLLAAGCAAVQTRHHAAEDLPNFLQVDGRLYRGGQPTREGIRQLARLGVKTVVDLRSEGSATREDERQLVESLGMAWVALPMRAYWRPSDRQVQEFLRLMRDPSQQPVFVHCRKGRDRVGVMVGVYHVVMDGWDPPRAYADARARGMTRWNPLLRHIVLREAQPKYIPSMAAAHQSMAQHVPRPGGE